MQRQTNLIATFALAALALAACKAAEPSLTQGGSQLSPSTSGLHFSLAKYASSEPDLDALHDWITVGAEYLSIGTPEKFQLRTDFNVDSNGISRAPTLKAEYWLDSVVLGELVDGGGARGQGFDVMAMASLDPVGVIGTVRFLGQDRLKGTIRSSWEHRFTRDLTEDAYPYEHPLLGVKFNVGMGGEFAVRIDIGEQADHAMLLTIAPSVAVTAGISGKITLLSFVSAEAIGKVNLVNADFVSSIALGYYPLLDMMASTMAMDSASISALEGKISIGANVGADLKSVLPAEVNADLWLPAPFVVSGGRVSYDWVHDVWTPAPVYLKTFPTYSATAQGFVVAPGSPVECAQRVTQFRSEVRRIVDVILLTKEALDQQVAVGENLSAQAEMKGLDALKDKYQLILQNAQAYCAAI